MSAYIVRETTMPWFFEIGGKLDLHRVNGQPGAIFRDRDDKVVNTWELDGQIQAIRTVLNPDKLGHLGPVADSWELTREANRARRHPD